MPLSRPPLRSGTTVARFAALVASLAAPVLVKAQPAPACAAAVAIRDSAGLPLRGGVVLAHDAAHRTDSLGNVRFATATSTPLVARIRHIGFAPGRVMLFPTCGAAPLSTEVTLDPIATRLRTVTVSATRRPVYAGPLGPFYERRARGDGVFFTNAEMASRNAQRLSDVLRTVNGLGELGMRPNAGPSRNTGRRGVERCYPLLIIDGMAQSTIGEISTEGFDPRSLAGVEVYPDASRTPPEFLSIGNGSRCGTIVIWSRRSDTHGATPDQQRSASVPDSLVFDEGDVDQLAVMDTARSVAPVYPAMLRRKALDGEVAIEVVVDSEGRPDPRRVRVLRTTHRAFGDAVLSGLSLFTFVPARRDDIPVAQRVRMTVAFKADDR